MTPPGIACYDGAAMRASRLLLPLVLAAAGCVPCASQAPVLLPDGGAAGCVQSTDCPRPAGVLLCTSDEDQLRGCVGCSAARCVRWTPEACR